MNIEKLSAQDSIKISDLKRMGRKIKTETADPLYLVNMEIDDRTAGALLLAPEGAEYAEFICAGQNGVWMRDEAAYEFMLERNRMVEEGRSVKGNVAISEEVLSQALLHGFRIVATPYGDVEMVRASDDFSVSITNNVWSDVTEGFVIPSASEAAWLVSRNDRDEQGDVTVSKEISLEEAIGASYLLEDPLFSQRSSEQDRLNFDSLDALTAVAGELPEYITADAPEQAPEVEAELDNQSSFRF